MGLSTEQQILIEQRVMNEAKSVGTAYLLLFFMGWAGAHRFYLGHKGTAIVMLVLSLTIVGLFVTGIWVLVDLFLIPGMVEQQKKQVRDHFTQQALIAQPPAAKA